MSRLGSPSAEKLWSHRADGIRRFYPELPEEVKEDLMEETINAILEISGHNNPPARHIVGLEGVNVTREKLKCVSEELEEFSAVGYAVDETNDEEA